MRHRIRGLLCAWLIAAVPANSKPPRSLLRKHQEDTRELSEISKHRGHGNSPADDPATLNRTNAMLSALSGTGTDYKASQGERNHQYPGMLPGRDEQTPLSSCVSSSFGAMVLVLLGIVVYLCTCLHFQLQRKARLHTQVRSNLAKLHAEQRLLAAEDEKLRTLEALEQEEKVLMKAIHDRGNVRYDESRREFLLQKEIVFEPEFTADGRRLPKRVAAKFSDPALAKVILSDFAELLRILKTSVVLIEGHTKGASLQDMGDYEHDVADARANLVKDTIVHLGIEEFRLATLGLPGFLGNGNDDVVLKMVN